MVDGKLVSFNNSGLEKYGNFIGDVNIIDSSDKGNKYCVEQKIKVLSIVSISSISKP